MVFATRKGRFHALREIDLDVAVQLRRDRVARRVIYLAPEGELPVVELKHANHPAYVDWCDEATSRVMVRAGLDPLAQRPARPPRLARHAAPHAIGRCAPMIA